MKAGCGPSFYVILMSLHVNMNTIVLWTLVLALSLGTPVPRQKVSHHSLEIWCPKMWTIIITLIPGNITSLMAKYYTSAAGTSVILANRFSRYQCSNLFLLSMHALYLSIATLLFEEPLPAPCFKLSPQQSIWEEHHRLHPSPITVLRELASVIGLVQGPE